MQIVVTILTGAYLDHVNQLIDGDVFSADDVATHDAVLPTDRLHYLLCEHALRDHGLEVHGTSVAYSVQKYTN